jgi:hypothetical protein
VTAETGFWHANPKSGDYPAFGTQRISKQLEIMPATWKLNPRAKHAALKNALRALI